MQEGIFWEEKSTPGLHLGLVFFRVESNEITGVYDLIKKLWDNCCELKHGRTIDEPDIVFPTKNLTVTIGYGKNLFNKNGIRRNIPNDLKRAELKSPKASGGGGILNGSGLNYRNDVIKNFATEDFAFQFTADSLLAVSRALLTCQTIINSNAEFKKICSVVCAYTGFQREDRRSWIGFHDGISNLRSGQERFDVINIKPSIEEERWTVGGSYLYFLRIVLDVEKWNAMPVNQQERLVGRKKVTGCPAIKFNDDNAVTAAGCPVTGTGQITDIDGAGNVPNQTYFNAPIPQDLVVEKAHIHRANKHVEPSVDRNSLRIFRQGYEFFQIMSPLTGFEAGLNFISFQDTPQRVERLLVQPSWLGKINFGGEEAEQENLEELIQVLAGGIYLLPPGNTIGKVPGYELFET